MEEWDEFELIVHQGQRPLWQTILASLSFLGMFFLLYQCGLMFYNFGYSEYCLKKLPSFVELTVYCLGAGIALSVTKSVLIDLDKDKLVSRFYLGPFSYDKIATVPSLEYISVFRDAREQFQVNLWYKGNKHYKMYVFETSEPAFVFAKHVALKLKIDLLDTTRKGDFQWLEME